MGDDCPKLVPKVVPAKAVTNKPMPKRGAAKSPARPATPARHSQDEEESAQETAAGRAAPGSAKRRRASGAALPASAPTPVKREHQPDDVDEMDHKDFKAGMKISQSYAANFKAGFGP